MNARVASSKPRKPRITIRFRSDDDCELVQREAARQNLSMNSFFLRVGLAVAKRNRRLKESEPLQAG